MAGAQTGASITSPDDMTTPGETPVKMYRAGDAPPGAGIHHPKFGEKLKEKMDALKIECVLKHPSDYPSAGGNVHQDIVKFLSRHFEKGHRSDSGR